MTCASVPFGETYRLPHASGDHHIYRAKPLRESAARREREGERTVTLTEYTCERCAHAWLPRSLDRPRIGPHCKSAYWDRPARAQANGHKKGKK